MARLVSCYSTWASELIQRVIAAERLDERALPSIEESGVVVVAHDPSWAEIYAREAPRVASAFGARCAAIEHIGSTAVRDLPAKPIVDLLVASSDGAAPSSRERAALAALAYVFLGQDERRPGRWLWRKRQGACCNLSLVPFDSDLWRHNLSVRDYLRAHPGEARLCAEAKQRAAKASPDSLFGYQDYKREHMDGLRARAIRWGQSST